MSLKDEFMELEKSKLKTLFYLVYGIRYGDEIHDKTIDLIEVFSVWIDQQYGKDTADRWIDEIEAGMIERRIAYREMKSTK